MSLDSRTDLPCAFNIFTLLTGYLVLPYGSLVLTLCIALIMNEINKMNKLMLVNLIKTLELNEYKK